MSEFLNRHNMLWEGSRMFLPEHRAALLQRKQDEEAFIPPQLDEDQLVEMNRLLMEAVDGDFPLLVRYVNRRRPCEWCGFVQKINPHERWIRLANGRETTTIPFSDIYGMEKATDRDDV
ncbi:YolD-like family protein [Laceyella sacchari]|uniref:YolD-like protein n=1 Tax=Laceyella tengchongensis TaxID=574699 RepID=A0AA45WMR3_9BACL|nr:YolD-like family protein [Laceyella tengchongensis]AUS09719.1 YolD-like family protein [Laceyella sacchari]MRG27891.1 YolD-like family protein [Laceyella tengchongensis]SMP14932.1 YolD-like protein [Laceyella tengchongensis]